MFVIIRYRWRTDVTDVDVGQRSQGQVGIPHDSRQLDQEQEDQGME